MAVTVPADHEVQPAKPEDCKDPATCGTCELTWDDAIVTGMTPAPSGRCPFEAFHDHSEETTCEVDDCEQVGKACGCGAAHCPEHPHEPQEAATPGPWTVQENEGVPLGYELIGPEGQVVALVYEKDDADAIAAAMNKED